MVDCNHCYKHDNQFISKECIFCQKYSFQEAVLCDLLRTEQYKRKELECFAFRPNLKIIGEKAEIQEKKSNDCKKETNTSDRQQWLKAYMLQQLKINPEKVHYRLNYHLCLVTNKREKLLKKVIKYFPDPSILFSNIGDLFNGSVDVLCINSDHIHLYIESSPDYSLDDIVNKIVPLFEMNLQKQLPQHFKDKNIFQKSYFIESIG